MPAVLVAVASCQQHLTDSYLQRVQALAPDLALYVVSEFASSQGHWIPYRLERSVEENLARCMAELNGVGIHLCAVVDQNGPPYEPLRELASRLPASRHVYFNEALEQFTPGARSRVRAWYRYQLSPAGLTYRLAAKLKNPRDFARPILYRLAKRRGSRHQSPAGNAVPELKALPSGISVIIPSRNGRELLARCLPLVMKEQPSQIIVIDNGSDDGTIDWLRREFPEIEIEHSPTPLSFSAAINRGLARVKFSRVCLLNNDMEIEVGFLRALVSALDHDGQLFCATPQIFFPEGKRREETGKAVMPLRVGALDFPLACIEPVEGEHLSPVLYGSGGCSLYDTAKLQALGGFDESYAPAYVEDLDISFRGWQHGWPTVFVSGACVLHRHRATTSRYYTPEQIQLAVERNYLRFLLRNIEAPEPFGQLWRAGIDRINILAATQAQPPIYLDALQFAARADTAPRSAPRIISDDDIFALGSGDIACFPGRQEPTKDAILVASCYAPFPLSHGGAVRMYNLMLRAARDFSQILIYFVDELHTPPPELLDICAELIQVRRRGSHAYSRPDLPDVVQDFSSPTLAAFLRQCRAKIVQLEFTQLAQYAGCSPGAKTILVEHDVTIDLYRQLAATATGATKWELDCQLNLWERFERNAWRQCEQVVAMSDRDRATIGDKATVIPNGVDTDRFQPSEQQPEHGRLLFIGSFAHLPNLMAIEFFAKQVWPRLRGTTLHVIAGNRPEYYLDFYKGRIDVNLAQPNIDLEGFVADVRSAYARAQIVVAPLVASAGTNIKILEAMAMGKAIVSTPAGINGLDLNPGRDVVVVETGDEMAAAIQDLVASPSRCLDLGREARRTVCERYDWDRIAERQTNLYKTLLAEMA